MSIGQLEQYLDALLDLPQPANDEARANWRRALHALRDKYAAESAAYLGISVAEYHAFSDVLVAGVPSSIQAQIHAQIFAMTPGDLHEYLEQFLRDVQAKLDREDE